MRFTKMQGAGNDYIYLNGFEKLPADLSALSRRMSDRHFGIGADGIVVILKSATPFPKCYLHKEEWTFDS